MEMGEPSVKKQSIAIDPAEFKIGWRVLIMALIGTATSVSTAPLYSFGTFVVPMQEAFDWSRGEVQAAISMIFACSVIAAPVAGWLNKRFGLRPVALVSLVTLPLGYLAMTLNTGSIVLLYAGYGMLAFAGMGTLTTTWTHCVNLWFDKNRGLALAFMLCGTGLSGLVLPPLVTAAIEAWGWQAGFYTLAGLTSLITLPMARSWMQSSGPVGDSKASRKGSGGARALPGETLGEALKTPRLWLCNIGLTLPVMAMIGIVSSGVPMLIDGGLTATEAANTFSVYGISLILGRVVVGYLVDRIWAPGVAFFTLIMPAFGCAIFYFVQGEIPWLILGAILVGIGAGAEMDLAAFLMSRYFGMRDYSRVFAFHFGFISVFATVTPILFAFMYEWVQGHSAMLIFSMVSFVVGSTLLLAMGRYPNFELTTQEKEQNARMDNKQAQPV